MQKDVVRRFFTGTGESYDLIVNLFTYGADRYWKRKMQALVPPATKILDLACGTGILTFSLADRNSNCRIVGVDMMQEYILIARKKQETSKHHNIKFICSRAEDVKLKETFDCITSSYIPKYVSAVKLLENISPNLREGGVLVLHDFTLPTSSIPRRIWGLHMFLVKCVGPRLFPEWRTVFYELADLVRSTRWFSEYVTALPRFGYRNIQTYQMTAGSAAIIYAEKGEDGVRDRLPQAH